MPDTEAPAPDRAPRATLAAPSGGRHPQQARVIALQRAIGNAATVALLRAPTAKAPAPSLADRAHDAIAAGHAGTVLKQQAGRPIAAVCDLLDALSPEDVAKLSAAIDATLKGPAANRIWAAVLGVTDAPPEKQMERWLFLSKADSDALGRWLTAHRPLKLPEPQKSPLRRTDGATFTPSAPALADADWVAELLRFFHYGAPAMLDPSHQACVFDGAPDTVTSVVTFLSTLMVLDGRDLGPLNPSGPDDVDAVKVRTVVEAPIRDGARIAAAVRAKDWTAARHALEFAGDGSMAAILDALEWMRFGEPPSQPALIETLAQQPLNARLAAAVLAAQKHLGIRLHLAQKALSEPDRAAIREHLDARRAVGDSAPTPAALQRTDADGVHAFTAAAGLDDRAWTLAFLRFFRFGPNPLSDRTYMLNDRSVDFETVVDTVLDQARVAGRSLDPDVVWDVAVTESARIRTAVTPGRQLVVQYTLQRGWHVHQKTGQSSSDWSHQVGAQYTFQFKFFDGSEIDVSVLAQAGNTANDVIPKEVNVQLAAGAQIAWVIPIYKDIVQLQQIVQAVGGAAISRDQEDSGQMTVRTDPMAQVQGQLQVVVSIPGTGAQLFLQAAAGYTFSPDPTYDRVVAGGFQWAWDFPFEKRK